MESRWAQPNKANEWKSACAAMIETISSSVLHSLHRLILVRIEGRAGGQILSVYDWALVYDGISLDEA